MIKTFINNAVLGNSRLLACLTGKGELARLFWPNIDHLQHIEKMQTGIRFTSQKSPTVWLNDDNITQTQAYIPGTNIVKTVCVLKNENLRVTQTDFCLPDKDVLVRRYELVNEGCNVANLDFVIYSSSTTSILDYCSTLFEFQSDALVHYRRNHYMSVSADKEVYQFQIGNCPLDAAMKGELCGHASTGMTNEGAISYKLGSLLPGEKTEISIRLCISNTFKGLKKIIHDLRNTGTGELYKKTYEYWEHFLKGSKQVKTASCELNELYERSLLIFKLMADEKSGGLLAAPEADEHFKKCGRYAYCWGRDAAFITSALDKCGLKGTADHFYKWALSTQEEDGSWLQRYCMDGNLAPSWGLQIDETGSVIWGMVEHYKATRDESFLKEMWPGIQKGVEFLLDFIDCETGLVKPSFDLWEERVGEHSYSCAAVFAGLNAGCEAAEFLGASRAVYENWITRSAELRESMKNHLWREDRKCFLRGVKTQLPATETEPSHKTTMIEVNSKGYFMNVSQEDHVVDVSLLGLSIPFGVFKVDDYRMEATAREVERLLTSPKTGGIKRYENDQYIGGNPWVLTTLWLSLYHIEKRDFAKGKELFYWAVNSRTDLNLLPEQIDKETGNPAWIIPLTWSHAMFVLALHGLVEGGAL